MFKKEFSYKFAYSMDGTLSIMYPDGYIYSQKDVDGTIRNIKIGDGVEDVLSKVPSQNRNLQKWAARKLYSNRCRIDDKLRATIIYYFCKLDF